MTDRLPPVLDDLREQLREAAARDNEIEARVAQRVRRGRRRQWLLVTLGAVVTFAGVAVAERAVERHGPDTPPDTLPRELTAAADRGVVTSSAAADPGGGPPWAVLVFTNPAGLDCVAIGRLLDGRLGTYDQSHTFRAFPRRVGGSCEALGRSGLLVAVKKYPLAPRRTIIYGLARDRRPVRITIGEVTRIVQPGGQGSFVDVRTGVLDLTGATATTTVDGRTTRRPLSR